MARYVIAALVLAGVAVWFVWPRAGFDDETIAQVKQSIRDQWASQGRSVTEVELIREAPRKLTGFARLKVDGSDLTVQKHCTATMDEDDTKYIWRCE